MTEKKYSKEEVKTILTEFLNLTNDSVPEQQGGYDFENERWISGNDLIETFMKEHLSQCLELKKIGEIKFSKSKFIITILLLIASIIGLILCIKFLISIFMWFGATVCMVQILWGVYSITSWIIILIREK